MTDRDALLEEVRALLEMHDTPPEVGETRSLAARRAARRRGQLELGA